MALFVPYKKYILHFIKITRVISLNKIRNKCNAVEVKAIDEFTRRLLQNKTDKWTIRKSFPKYSVNELSSREAIDKSLQEAIKSDNNDKIIELIEECITCKICPSISNLLYALSVCSQTGKINTIKELRRLCKQHCPETLAINSDFDHYLAQAFWTKGNTSEALNLFKKVYQENSYLRRRIRQMWKHLMTDITENRSEVILNNSVKFSKDIAATHGDFYFLGCVWQMCFLSEWFADQSIAFELMDKYEELCKVVGIRIPYVVMISLNHHRTEVVYRLLEMLLKLEMKTHYTGVLLSLLDYQIHQRNLSSCMEIIRWSERHGVVLLPVQHHKYLNLLIEYKPEDITKEKKPIRVKSITYFKF
ncbi:unnamed protein product [Phyllotreta striolata]|uniref:Uncharacterized protein n=1 Tax=Phyllotreta striolata TaxID=444603 RepID=A0A9N9U0U1_PHYSR|nr:unnamed protein product [Phyllotreta striolata]